MAEHSRGRYVLSAVAMAVLLAGHVFVLMPITMYGGNTQEFTAALTAALAVLARPAFFVVALIALLAMVLPARGNRRLAVLLAAVNVLLWLQGNILVWDYGLFNGHAINWSEYNWHGWFDSAVWCGIFIAALATAERAGRRWLWAAAITFAMAATGAFSAVIVRVHDLAGKDTGNGATALDNMYRFSTDKNVLHIVADGFQSDIFWEILNDGATGKQLSGAMDGFVFFKEHMGAFPFTHMSVPALLSGKLYDNSVPVERFLDAAVGAGAPTILNTAAAAGYDIDLAVSSDIEGLYARGAATNVLPLSSHFHASSTEIVAFDAARLTDYSLFRLSPHLLKRLIYNDQRWLAQQMFARVGQINLPFFAHTAFLDAMRENMVVDRPKSVYKLFHIMLSHEPFATNEQCRYAGGVLPLVRDAVKAQARCGLIEVIKLLERMKALGIYDSTTIVLMGDHGAWVPPPEFVPDPSLNAGDVPINSIAVALAVPLFVVKPAGSTGKLRVSNAPSWIIDTARTVAAAAGIEGRFEGRDALRLLPGEARERRFYNYQYAHDEWSREYLKPIQLFNVNGSVFDGESWKYRTTLPPGGTEPEQQ